MTNCGKFILLASVAAYYGAAIGWSALGITNFFVR